MSPPRRRDLVAAAWWSASLRARPAFALFDRWQSPLAWAGAGLVVGGCADILAEVRPPEPERAALEQQEESGWNVGGEGTPLAFPSPQDVDVSGSGSWRDGLTTLTARLAPAGARWAPYYNPTLFQSLEAPRSADLRAVVRPIFTPEMALASRRGEALLSLLIEDGVCRSDVAVVLDLPGPEAVALAAALAPCLDPVFLLANWPHPMGVVPAHLTLGATLYFLPAFERQRASRPALAAPAFVLDRQRLARYTDDAGQFDNRYLASLPPREALQAAGIQHLLYVTPDDRVFLESDDLNDDLVAIDGGGMDVKMLALSDFAEAPLPDWPEPAPCAPAPLVTLGPGPRLYFGGSPGSQACFSYWYGWRSQPPLAVAPPPAPPPRLAPRCRFHPAPRATFGFAPHAATPGSGWRSRSVLGSWHHSGGFGGFGGWGRSGSLGRTHSALSG